MNTSETITDLAGALAKAQAEMKNAIFNRTNPHFRSKYADLASVRDAITPALSKHGLSVIQALTVTDSALIVRTRLMHASGQWLESDYPIINDTSKPQAMGSALTYARRYSLAAICNIASEDDDDGEAAQDHGSNAPEVRNIAGTPKASKSNARFDYEQLILEMRKNITAEGLKEWLKLNRKRIEALPADWIEHLDTAYTEHKETLMAKVAA